MWKMCMLRGRGGGLDMNESFSVNSKGTLTVAPHSTSCVELDKRSRYLCTRPSLLQSSGDIVIETRCTPYSILVRWLEIVLPTYFICVRKKERTSLQTHLSSYLISSLPFSFVLGVLLCW